MRDLRAGQLISYCHHLGILLDSYPGIEGERFCLLDVYWVSSFNPLGVVERTIVRMEEVVLLA